MYTAPTEIYTLSLHDALPISIHGTGSRFDDGVLVPARPATGAALLVPTWRDRGAQHNLCAPSARSEEHTSELQSRFDLVCRLLLEKKKKKTLTQHPHNSLYYL